LHKSHQESCQASCENKIHSAGPADILQGLVSTMLYGISRTQPCTLMFCFWRKSKTETSFWTWYLTFHKYFWNILKSKIFWLQLVI